MIKTFQTITIISASMMLAILCTSCSAPTNACFTFTPTTITTSTDIIFDGSCSEMTSLYTWKFGDGTNDTTTDLPVITHRFNAPGLYTVTLIARRKDHAAFVRKGKPTQEQTIMVH